MDSTGTHESNISDIGIVHDDLILMVDGVERRRIPVPSTLKEDSVFIALRRLVNSYYLYRTWSLSRYESAFYALAYFCENFKDAESLVFENGCFLLSRRTGQIFIDHLVSKKLAESTIYNHSEAMKILLQHCNSVECSGFLDVSVETWRRTKEILDDWPKICKPETLNHRPGLTEKFEVNCDEQQMLMSVKLFCPWFLSECRRIRKEFRERCPEEFQWLLQQASDQDRRRALERPAVTLGVRSRGPENQVYSTLINAMKNIDSPLYYETVLFKGVLLDVPGDEWNEKNGIMDGLGLTFPQAVIDYGTWDKDKVVSRLESFQCALGITRRQRVKPGERTFFNMRALFSPMFMLIPSPEEKMVISWLLAAERVQKSNLHRIRMQDVQKVNSLISVSSYKGRNSTTVSAYFRRGDPAYVALMEYKDNIMFGYESGLINRVDAIEDAAFIPGLREAWFLFYRHKMSCCLFLPLIVQSSNTQRAYLEYCSRISTTACPDYFLKCMSSADEANADFFSKRNSRKRSMHQINKTGSRVEEETDDGDADTGASPGSRSLGPQTVAQTCVLGNDSARAMKSFQHLELDEQMAVKFDESQAVDDRIHAARMRHSLNSEGVYSDFSKCKQKVEVDQKFGALVGSEMRSIAAKVAESMIDKSRIVSLHQVEKLLKLTGNDDSNMLSDERILECAQLQEFVVDKVGLFEKDGMTYVVKTPLVAALIKGKIDHIEKGFARLVNDNPLRVKKVLSLLVFYKALLNEFGKDVVRMGIEKYSRYEISFSDLNI